MPRPSNTQQRRREIVQALLKVMADQGYAKASIHAIAQQAGLKPGLIHYHFKTKQEILVELVKEVSQLFWQRYESLLIGVLTPTDRLKAFVDARLAKGHGEHPEAVAAWVVIGTEAIRQPEVKAEYEKSIAEQLGTLTDLIVEVAEGKRSIKKVKALAGMSLSAMEGSFQLSVAANNVMPTDYAASALIDFILGAVDSME